MIWNSSQSLMLFQSDYGELVVNKLSGSLGLCENKPDIDVVYTWVNGSEVTFLRNLLKVKRNYLEMIHGQQVNCSIPLECIYNNRSANNHPVDRLIFMDTTLVAIDSSMDIKGLEMFKSIKSFETITSQSIGSQYYLLYLTKGNLIVP